jgi:hypothetical protein
MTPRWTAEDAKLVFDADDIHIRDVQKIRRTQIRGEVLLGDLKAHFRRIIIAISQIVHGHDETLHGGKFLGHGAAQIGGERGDAAFARQIITEERDFTDIRSCWHESAGQVIVNCTLLSMIPVLMA